MNTKCGAKIVIKVEDAKSIKMIVLGNERFKDYPTN